MAVEHGQDLKKIQFKDQSWLGLKTRSSKIIVVFFFCCLFLFLSRADRKIDFERSYYS